MSDTPVNKDRLKTILRMIIEDCEQDVKDFEGREFNGKTLGELHGILEAKIETLAKILKQFLEIDNDPPN